MNSLLMIVELILAIFLEHTSNKAHGRFTPSSLSQPENVAKWPSQTLMIAIQMALAGEVGASSYLFEIYFRGRVVTPWHAKA